MRIIEQSHEIIDRSAMTPAQLIELCGRTCYKSEDKITDDSADKFVRMLTSRGHLSVLEHVTMALQVGRGFYLDIREMDHERLKYMNITRHADRYVVSANLRAWLDFVDNDYEWNEWLRLKYLVWEFCPPAYEARFGKAPTKNWWIGATPINPAGLTEAERLIHQYATVKFITNRGVTHELVRHRPASYSQESTRYVNYGGDDISFIKPVWWDDQKWDDHVSKNSRVINDKVVVFLGGRMVENGESYPAHELYAMITFFEGCASGEAKYHQLLKWGWRPEQAREVLPNSLKTEIVVTASLKEWRHILKLRTSKAAHPQIRELMTPLLDEMGIVYLVHFDKAA